MPISPYVALAGTGFLACLSQGVRQAFTDSLTRTFNRITDYIWPLENDSQEVAAASKDILKNLIEFAADAKKKV